MKYNPFSRNELSQNSNGGTEITTSGLEKYLRANMDEEILNKFQFITSRVRELHDDKIRVLHLHDLPNDPESAHLANPANRDKFHAMIYVSHWQKLMYHSHFKIPYDNNSFVIENGVDTIFPRINPLDVKPKDKIRLIYFSTPHRGLNILLTVFDQLAKEYDNLHLDVFSSFKLYGWESRDKGYEPLFEYCKNHPNITYHGTASHEELIQTLKECDILAYPSIWPETSCRVLIESMMAGLICVHSSLGALPETSGGLTHIYDYVEDINLHAAIFYSNLKNAITHVIKYHESEDNYVLYNAFQSNLSRCANYRFSWNNIGPKWVTLLLNLYDNYKDRDLSIPKEMFSVKTS